MKSEIQSGSRVSRLNKSGFTLVELLAVTLIMAMLAAIVVGLSGYASRRSSESQTKAELQFLRDALGEYRLEMGFYPREDLSTTGDWDRYASFLTSRVERARFEDAWGRPYQYRSLGRFSYDLWSYGPTGPEAGDYEFDNIR